MKKIEVNKEWYETRLSPALLDWKAGVPREKAKGIVLGLLKLQRECGKTGQKNVLGQAVVSVSSRMVSAFYRDYASQKKFTHWVTKHGLVFKDRSWLNEGLAKELHRETRCDSWHITEPAFGKKKKVTVRYDDNYGIYGIYRKAILKAEGTKVDDAHCFHGEWAIDSYSDGNLPWSDFIEVGKAAHNVIKGQAKTKGPSCRVFDAVSMCKKTLRGRCFTDADGNESKEVFDIPAAITFTAPLAMAAFGMSAFDDVELWNWAYDLSTGTSADPYKHIWRFVYDVDAKTNAYGAAQKWTKGVRKTVKMDLQCVSNCNLDYLRECKEEYHRFFANMGIPDTPRIHQNKRRQWLLYHAALKANKPFGTAVRATKVGGISDAFYRLHTFGEKMIMNLLIKEFKARGIVVHRVHDALWSADKRLTGLTDKQMDVVVGRIVMRFMQTVGRTPCGRRAIHKMLIESGITRKEAEWVWEGIKDFAQGARSNVA